MSPLSGKWKIPLVGEVPKPAVLGGLAVTGFLIWRYRSKNAAAGAPAASGSAYPPDGTVGDPNDPYSTDPATGMTYGDEQAGAGGVGGASGLVTGADAYPWDGTYGNTSDPYSMDTSTGQTYGNEGNIGNTGGGPGGGTGGPPFSTNAQWSQYVLGYFSDNGYGSIPQRTDAIGRYIAGEKVDSQQEGWINEAIAIGGRPPVAGRGNFPPGIRVEGSKTGGKTYAANPVTGLHVKVSKEPAGGPRKTQPRRVPVSAEISWHGSAHAATYDVKVTQGKKTHSVHHTSATHITISKLEGHAEYEVRVLARPARPSAREATTRFRA